MNAWTRAALTVLAASGLVFGGLAAPAAADGGGGAATVLVQDRCDPATFNAALNDPGACVAHSNGEVTFQKLFSSIAKDPSGVLADRDVRGWRFHSDDVTIRQGRDLVVTNTGGEFHTFTPVTAYGGGCVPFVNAAFGLGFNAACAGDWPATGVLPGTSIHVSNLAKGTYKFECMIHPWMRSDVTVR